MKEMDDKKYMDFEYIPDTWAWELREHFEAFSNFCWEGFNRSTNLMNEMGHDNKIDKYKWREYVLWDMIRRHKLEKDVNKSL